MNNTLIVLDLFMGYIEVMTRLERILRNAQVEGRDVTDEELAELRAENRGKAAAFLGD